ncbi:glyoxylase-like metal-dependent hydrolase (beta-lactamase superfamily II) [Brevibacterium sanguinis]|uniref:Glyoxylase-like metal-dependent hydrolase (Beta-lactamase superfamily II) n=2 Tax=Brevibacterium TaxID=1696 RepID=A0A366IL86_9MICO|nr:MULTISPECIES: MBL fold metallo-hydrolase [Brevibacterium]RBP65563.1 glyoxylase-like metal-dependent hydrolase (beta-lactamase superfamily II) [Brevibacterium sanguinis]RBP72197.1 glyoxylase-like metal-dependent hydrolase (beta-lactamase superfamily II) [Brevibacterium celere]
MAAAIEHLVTKGTFSLDGGTWDVDNNVWIVGNDSEVIVIDPAHDPEAIAEAVNGREVKAILLTHGHDDHVAAVRDFAHRVGNPPVHLNPEDRVLWDMTYEDYQPDREITDGDTFSIDSVRLKALHTPGHSPGSTCFFIETGLPVPDSAGAGAAVGPVLFSGDTLFNGGPGATGRSYSSFETIIESIRDTLFTLPEATIVLTGHGDATSIGAEKPNLDEWVKRGH